ncbi:hypothetical protein ABZV58_29010 [Nocardia sp. NPDC004654]|uniref:hypothetical protein n=1 Tax=Nocardia sp. NPDC004654 TaxID=3154776 RepID=UPI0033A29F74
MTAPDWYDQLPSARTLWRALRTPVFDPGDYAYPEVVAATVGLLDAHYRHEAAVCQLTGIAQCGGHIEEDERRVVTDFFAAASRDIAALITRVDTFTHHRVLALGVDDCSAALYPCGLGTVLARHARRCGDGAAGHGPTARGMGWYVVTGHDAGWALAAARIGTLVPDSTVLTVLAEEASAYNRLVERVLAGQVRLPAPTRADRTPR